MDSILNKQQKTRGGLHDEVQSANKVVMSYSGLCRELLCQRDHTRTDGECKSIMLGVAGAVFQMKLKVTVFDAISERKILLFSKEFGDFLRLLLLKTFNDHSKTFNDHGYEVYGLEIWYKKFVEKRKSLLGSMVTMVSVFSKDIAVYMDLLGTLKTFFDNDLNIGVLVDGEEIDVVLSIDSSLDVQEKEDDVEAFDLETNQTLINLYSYRSPALAHDFISSGILLTELDICLNIKLLPEEYKVHGKKLYLSNQGIYLYPDQFFATIQENETIRIICAFHLYKDFLLEVDDMKTITASVLFSQRNSTLYILTSVLTAISMTASVSLLVILHFAGRYHNNPGKITGILGVHLFLSQGLYLFGINQTAVPLLCSLLGVFIHFFWLSTFFWMGSCTFHLVSVFCFNNRLEFLYPPILVIYFLFCYIASSVLICITVGHATVTSGGQEIGYGGRICYISSPVMIGYTFALPVGIVILFNIFACLAVIIRIHNDRCHPHGQGKSFALVYLKISVFSGVHWVLGYIYVLTGFAWTEYLFVIFSASQGLFLLLSQSTTKSIFRSCAGLSKQNATVREIEMVALGTKSTRN